MPSKMKMWLYPKPTREIQYSKPYCVDFKPFLRELETVDSKDEYETVCDMNYGSVEASVKETVYDSGWGECLVLVERCFPHIPAPVIYRCIRYQRCGKLRSRSQLERSAHGLCMG